jgi:hypothetical protein
MTLAGMQPWSTHGRASARSTGLTRINLREPSPPSGEARRGPNRKPKSWRALAHHRASRAVVGAAARADDGKREYAMAQLADSGVPRPAKRSKAAPTMARPTPQYRAAVGKAARTAAPLKSHEAFDPGAARPDPLGLPGHRAGTRMPDLVPVRYARMLVSPFSYFRGAALPMASDLAVAAMSGIRAQACGDAHLSNFGIFGSPERRLVFDIPVDEFLPGPWEWDVKRLAASLEVAGRENGFTPSRADAL